MTVPGVTAGEVVTEAWGDQVALDVNSLLGRTTALEGVNSGSRLTTLEAQAVVFDNRTKPIGARFSHSYNPAQVVLPGGSYQFDDQNYLLGMTDVGDHSGWTVVTAGVYAVSYSVNSNAGGTTCLSVGGAVCVVGTVYGDLKYGSWTGYAAVGALIKVMQLDGAGGPLLGGGLIDIFRVGEGG